jgi:acetyl esterase/lipase
MVRRVVGVAVSPGVIGALGFALGDRDEKVPSYPSTQALGRDISAHGIGCARVYPIRTLFLADHDAANCEVGSATVTLNVWGVSPPPIDLRARVPDYTAGHDAGLGLISPIFAELSGLPPLLIQAGSHEVLLDDAIRLTGVAAGADVEITLDITPGVPHVFQAYHPILEEAVEALDRAGRFLSAHLTESPTLEARTA